MLIREYTEGDLDALRAIHAAQGFDYALPDLRNPLFVTKLVLSDGNVAPGVSSASSSANPSSASAAKALGAASLQQGPNDTMVLSACDTLSAETVAPSGHVFGGALLRLTAEAYLLLDPRAGTPRERWQWILALHEATRRDAWQRGLEDVHAWLPPPIAQKFGRRLERIGWRRDDSWTPYCKRLEGK